jgi:anaerobic magnesium-protoporphyrin IX monomethyl ester cyclase
MKREISVLSTTGATKPLFASKQKKLLLVHSPIDATNYADAKQHYAPSQGLIALRTFIRQSCPDVEVQFLDGTFLDTDTIIKCILRDRPDWVGQSIQQLSYGQALAIARAAKESGARNVFGGQHATQLAAEIMANQHDIVDVVIRHDGEIPMAMLCHDVPYSQIANATYWDGAVSHNFAIDWKLDIYPLPDYDGIDLAPYVECYTRRLQLPSPRTFLRTHSHKGCGNRYGSHACYFCGRADRSVRFKDPSRYVRELIELRSRWGAGSVFDTGDDIAYSKAWLESVARQIEHSDLELDLGCFGRTCKLVDPEVPQLLRRMGVSNIIIGFESGDPAVLNRCGKGGVTPEDNLVAAANLFDSGIDVCASYVIGLPGENEATLRRTYENAQQLLDVAQKRLGRRPYELVANFFEPSPGSPAFRRVKQANPEKYEGQDVLDLEEVQYDYFKSHWALSSPSAVREFRRLLVEWAMRINSLTAESDSQGFRAEEVTRGTERDRRIGGAAA